MRTRMYGGVRGRKTKVGGKPTFVFLLLDLIDSVGITSLRSVFPSSAGHHQQMKRSALSALSLLFHTASALEQARLAGYKTTTPDFRQALHLV